MSDLNLEPVSDEIANFMKAHEHSQPLIAVPSWNDIASVAVTVDRDGRTKGLFTYMGGHVLILKVAHDNLLADNQQLRDRIDDLCEASGPDTFEDIAPKSLERRDYVSPKLGDEL